MLICLVFLGNALLLATSLAAPYINPKDFWPPAFVALFFGIFLLVGAALLLWFVWRRKWLMAALQAAVLLACLPAVARLMPPLKPRPQAAQAGFPPLRLLSYNVQNLRWFGDKEALEQVTQNIVADTPDVVCLQDYLSLAPHSDSFIARLRRLGGFPYYYEYFTDALRGNAKAGQAIFSKYPLVELRPIPFAHSGANGGFQVWVCRPADTVRVINVHLQSVGLQDDELRLDPAPRTGRWGRWVSGITKIRNAVRKRSYQTDVLAEAVAESDMPTLLCGDFNDIPLSYTYRTMERRLDDCFLDAGRGLGATYHGRWPRLRIDYVFRSHHFATLYFGRQKRPGSDHYPLFVVVGR